MHTCDCTTDDCRVCPGRVVCRCLRVTEEQVVVAITTLSIRTIGELRETTGAGAGCTACHRKLKALMVEHVGLEVETRHGFGERTHEQVAPRSSGYPAMCSAK